MRLMGGGGMHGGGGALGLMGGEGFEIDGAGALGLMGGWLWDRGYGTDGGGGLWD